MNYLDVFNILKVKDANVWAESCDKYLPIFGITEIEDVARFLANCMNESGKFTVFKENLYYTTADRLKAVFPRAFDSSKYKSAIYNPNDYLKNPVKLANLVYNDKIFNKGLGNTVTDQDGSLFIGRSAIQITGRNNYKKLSDKTGIDFISHPELLEKPEYALLGSASWWQDAGCSKCTNLLATRQKVAGNYTNNPFGLKEVQAYYNIIKPVLFKGKLEKELPKKSEDKKNK